jgi:uncharacterized protein YggE
MKHRCRLSTEAICAAGREAQRVFGAPANHLAGAMDEAKIIKLTKHLHEEARSAPLNDGYQRAHELIVAHKAKVDRIAEKSGSRSRPGWWCNSAEQAASERALDSAVVSERLAVVIANHR